MIRKLGRWHTLAARRRLRIPSIIHNVKEPSFPPTVRRHGSTSAFAGEKQCVAPKRIAEGVYRPTLRAVSNPFCEHFLATAIRVWTTPGAHGQGRTTPIPRKVPRHIVMAAGKRPKNLSRRGPTSFSAVRLSASLPSSVLAGRRPGHPFSALNQRLVAIRDDRNWARPRQRWRGWRSEPDLTCPAHIEPSSTTCAPRSVRAAVRRPAKPAALPTPLPRHGKSRGIPPFFANRGWLDAAPVVLGSGRTIDGAGR